MIPTLESLERITLAAGRGNGKTTALVETAARVIGEGNKVVFLVGNADQVRHVESMAKEAMSPADYARLSVVSVWSLASCGFTGHDGFHLLVDSTALLVLADVALRQTEELSAQVSVLARAYSELAGARKHAGELVVDENGAE